VKDPAAIAFTYSLGLISHRIASQLHLKDINNIRANIKQKQKTPNFHENLGSGKMISICLLGYSYDMVDKRREAEICGRVSGFERGKASQGGFKI
jgi:hypothetical protein